jgi:hypothetical protein
MPDPKQLQMQNVEHPGIAIPLGVSFNHEAIKRENMMQGTRRAKCEQKMLRFSEMRQDAGDATRRSTAFSIRLSEKTENSGHLP